MRRALLAAAVTALFALAIAAATVAIAGLDGYRSVTSPTPSPTPNERPTP